MWVWYIYFSHYVLTLLFTIICTCNSSVYMAIQYSIIYVLTFVCMYILYSGKVLWTRSFGNFTKKLVFVKVSFMPMM